MGKLAPRFFRPFCVISRVGKVAYRLDLPKELSQFHITFHVSQLRKSLVDNTVVVPLDDIQFDECTDYIECLISILDRKAKALHNKVVPLVKV